MIFKKQEKTVKYIASSIKMSLHPQIYKLIYIFKNNWNDIFCVKTEHK